MGTEAARGAGVGFILANARVGLSRGFSLWVKPSGFTRQHQPAGAEQLDVKAPWAAEQVLPVLCHLHQVPGCILKFLAGSA